MSVDEQRLKRAVEEYDRIVRQIVRRVLEAADRPEPPPYPTDAMVQAYECCGGGASSLRERRRKGIAAAIAADTSRQAIIDAAVAYRDGCKSESSCCTDEIHRRALNVRVAVNEAGL